MDIRVDDFYYEHRGDVDLIVKIGDRYSKVTLHRNHHVRRP